LPEAESFVSLNLSHLTACTWPHRDAILGNVGTMIAFRLGLTDAEILEKEFYPEFSATDFVNLPNYRVYLKLMVDGVMSRAFSAVSLPGTNPTCVLGTA
jgi:hypothetical protein